MTAIFFGMLTRLSTIKIQNRIRLKTSKSAIASSRKIPKKNETGNRPETFLSRGEMLMRLKKYCAERVEKVVEPPWWPPIWIWNGFYVTEAKPFSCTGTSGSPTSTKARTGTVLAPRNHRRIVCRVPFPHQTPTGRTRPRKSLFIRLHRRDTPVRPSPGRRPKAVFRSIRLTAQVALSRRDVLFRHRWALLILSIRQKFKR